MKVNGCFDATFMAFIPTVIIGKGYREGEQAGSVGSMPIYRAYKFYNICFTWLGFRIDIRIERR